VIALIAKQIYNQGKVRKMPRGGKRKNNDSRAMKKSYDQKNINKGEIQK